MMTADRAFQTLIHRIPVAQPRAARNGTRLYLGPSQLTLDPHRARITSRPVSPLVVAAEFLWMLSGHCTNTRYLNHYGITIWDHWGTCDPDEPEDRFLGPIYGDQWRWWDVHDYTTHDQIRETVESCLSNPGTSQALVSAWNVADLDGMALPPCHFAHQVTPIQYGNTIVVDLTVFQRSCDVLIGLPYNMAFYGLLTQWYAAALTYHDPQKRSWVPGRLHFLISDAHIYQEHLDVPGVDEWLTTIRDTTYAHNAVSPAWHLPDQVPLINLEVPEDWTQVPAPHTLLERCEHIDPTFPRLKIPVTP